MPSYSFDTTTPDQRKGLTDDEIVERSQVLGMQLDALREERQALMAELRNRHSARDRIKVALGEALDAGSGAVRIMEDSKGNAFVVVPMPSPASVEPPKVGP